jgi:hypothetical protein
MSEADESLILEIHKEQKSGARRLEKIIKYKCERHIPHNVIHRVLLENNLAEQDRKKQRPRSPKSDMNESIASELCIFTGTPAKSMAKMSMSFLTTVHDSF